MSKVVGVSFRSGGRSYNFDACDLELKVDDLVIVETEKGIACGKVTGGMQQISREYLKKPLKRVLRKVTDEDLRVIRENRLFEKKARDFCYSRIEARGLKMKLVDVEYLFDRTKVIFYFTADGRIDFRELVRDLAGRLRTRIEMRQIGVRDEAKMLGGCGTCGKEFCCKTYIREFEPVSIKMAKHQNLTLNPSKISGACGRLMCCLGYEDDFYADFKKGLPKPGKTIMTREGQGKVISHNVIRGSITVQGPEGKLIEVAEPDLTRLRQGLPLGKKPSGKREPQKRGPGTPAPGKPNRSETRRPPKRKQPAGGKKPDPSSTRRVEAVEGKPGLLKKIRRMTGIEQTAEGVGNKRRRRRRRRRRGRSRSGSPENSSSQAEKK